MRVNERKREGERASEQSCKEQKFCSEAWMFIFIIIIKAK